MTSELLELVKLLKPQNESISPAIFTIVVVLLITFVNSGKAQQLAIALNTPNRQVRTQE